MNKVALITGANRGLGRGFAELLNQKGYRVYAGIRKADNAKALPDSVICLPLDVTDDASITQAMLKIKQAGDTIDLLINNAGLNKDTATNGDINQVCKLSELNRGKLMNMMSVNTISPLMVIKAAVPLMISDEALIINISSNRASFHDEFKNNTANYGYRASKVGLNMLTFALPQDLPKNISVCAVHPGDIKSDMNPAGSTLPIKAAGTLYRDVISSWKADFNGAYLRYDGSFYPI